MRKQFACLSIALVAAEVLASAATSVAASVGYAGSDSDIGGTFFPGGAAPYVLVPWRSETLAKPLDADGNNVYGSAGYALFATRFDYPNANATGGNAFVNPTDNSVYPNLVSLPSFVAGSQILSTRKSGGWAYALIDDPQLVNGFRDYNWGTTQVPPRPGADQSPYIKLGILDGGDTLGHPDPTVAPAARWSFLIGAGAPKTFRVGVMTDGLDANQWAPTKVYMQQVGGATVATGSLAPNRFVDMHFFDITGAQAGDQFIFLAQGVQGGSAGISGFTFDVPVPEPTSLVLGAMALAGLVRMVRRNSAISKRQSTAFN